MRIQAATLERIVDRIFTAAGCQPAEASCVARHLVDSNLCGHDSHGVIRVSRYLDFMKAGKVRPGRQMTVVFESDTVAVVDGNLGFGQVIGEQAMDLLAA
ncbi:MAG: Ldh family oxidoreductase, partial [Alphaproteobacteria bacterium]